MFWLIGLVMLFSGCASPYTSQYNMINQAYQEGRITTDQYIELSNHVQTQDTAWRQNISQSFISASQPSYQRPASHVYNNYNTNCHSDGSGNTNCTTSPSVIDLSR